MYSTCVLASTYVHELVQVFEYSAICKVQLLIHVLKNVRTIGRYCIVKYSHCYAKIMSVLKLTMFNESEKSMKTLIFNAACNHQS